MKQFLAICLLLLAVGPQLAQEPPVPAAPPPTAEAVKLSFAWAPGFQATVTSTKARTRIAPERSSRSATSRYSVRVEPAAENLRIRFADPTFEFQGDLKSLPASDQAQSVGLADLMTDYIVTKSGTFVGLHDVAAFQTRLRTFLAERLPAGLDPGALAQLDALFTSEAHLNARGAESWNGLVGTWLDGEMEFGAEYTSTSKEAIPVLPGEQVLMRYSFTARPAPPCHRGGVERDCVELEMRSTVDSEDMQRVLQLMMSRIAAGKLPETPTFQTLETENVLRLLTEPVGLIPHRYTLTRTIRGSVSVSGSEQRLEQVDSTETTYAYP